MASRLNAQTSNFDGSSSPITASGPIRLTISGTFDGAVLKLHSRTGTNPSYHAQTLPQGGRPRIALVSGDSYYYELVGARANTSVTVDDVVE